MIFIACLQTSARVDTAHVSIPTWVAVQALVHGLLAAFLSSPGPRVRTQCRQGDDTAIQWTDHDVVKADMAQQRADLVARIAKTTN